MKGVCFMVYVYLKAQFDQLDKVSFQREPPLILLTGKYIYELTKKKDRYRPGQIISLRKTIATCFHQLSFEIKT